MKVQPIKRNTQVVSISLSPALANRIDQDRKRSEMSRSAYLRVLVEKQLEDQRWERLYRLGEETAIKMGITSEADVERILSGNSQSSF